MNAFSATCSKMLGISDKITVQDKLYSILEQEENMNNRIVTMDLIHKFISYLRQEEKSEVTIEKYQRDVLSFCRFAGQSVITKDITIRYKRYLQEQGYATRSINSMLASINSLLRFLGWNDCRIKNIRVQRSIYCPEEKELTKEEYLRLLKASEKNPQLRMVMETICATGIRVSEVRSFTVEAVVRGEIVISCKNKTRTILVPGKLKMRLLNYAKKRGISSGAIFISRNGTPLDRYRIWKMMKNLCSIANVLRSKVFPHNLRKLFARTFYAMENDIAKLADILGHSSIDTTRIYIMTTGIEHRQKIEKLGLII